MVRAGSQIFLGDQAHVELWISSVFCVLFGIWGTEIDENVVPGPMRDQVSMQTPKNADKF